MSFLDLPFANTQPGRAVPNPEPRKRIKGRKQRAETTVKQRVRAMCVERDGDCRLAGASWHACSGESEWAHLGAQKRARTRGMAPEERHTTAGSLMLCTGAHRSYDEGQLRIDPTTPDGADGSVLFQITHYWWISEPRAVV